MKRGWRCCSPGCGTSVTDRASEAHQPLGFAFAVIPQSGLAAEVGPAIVAPPEIDESDPRPLGEEERIATPRRDRWPIEKRPLAVGVAHRRAVQPGQSLRHIDTLSIMGGKPIGGRR